jgi:hypothetical protein
MFESAVDAIVNGDYVELKRLLAGHPELAHARSSREHRSTLLHFVSANGVEDFRQKTPPNIVEIAKLLLEAGADVNAESDAYGGRQTTLGLTATSCHPEAAGVQIALMTLLIEHGAIIDVSEPGIGVNACLRNGRFAAAEFLSTRGGALDLEGAAGLGRLDIVRGHFDENRHLRPPATERQLKAGFAWACEYGQVGVVEFLLQHGVAADAKAGFGGETGLHWAGFTGNAELVKLLLEHGAPLDVRDERYGGTPLEWTIYGRKTAKPGARLEGFEQSVALIEDAWLRDKKRGPEGPPLLSDDLKPLLE